MHSPKASAAKEEGWSLHWSISSRHTSNCSWVAAPNAVAAAITWGEKNHSLMKVWSTATLAGVPKVSKDAVASTPVNPASRSIPFKSFPILGWPPLAARRPAKVAHATAVFSVLGYRKDEPTIISRLEIMPPRFQDPLYLGQGGSGIRDVH